MKLHVANYVERCVQYDMVIHDMLVGERGTSTSIWEPSICGDFEIELRRHHMDFVTKLLKTLRGHDTIWVVMDHLMKSVNFSAMRKTLSMDKLGRLINEVIPIQGVSVNCVL